MSTGTSCHFGRLLQVSKQMCLKSDFIHFFHDLIHVYSPGATADSRGLNFDVNRKALSLYPLLEVSKKSL